MKKLLIGLLIVSGLYSCGYAPIDANNGIIITKMESCIDHNLMHYYGKSTTLMHTFTVTSNYYCVIDSVNKYNIGDTLKINKK